MNDRDPRVQISASILNADWSRLDRVIHKVQRAGADRVHLDVGQERAELSRQHLGRHRLDSPSAAGVLLRERRDDTHRAQTLFDRNARVRDEPRSPARVEPGDDDDRPIHVPEPEATGEK